MDTKRKLIATALLAAAAVPAVVNAQARMPDTGFYAGAELGSAEIDNGPDDTAFRILGGYKFNRNVAGEVGYSQLLDKDGVEASALELAVVGMFPVADRFSVVGKIGFANIEVDAAGTSSDKTELTYGVGVQYDLTPRAGIRGMWQRYDTDNAVDVLSIGVLYRF